VAIGRPMAIGQCTAMGSVMTSMRPSRPARTHHTEGNMTFVASFILSGELYGVSDNNEVWRWDVDESMWVRVGTIDRGGA